LAVALGDAFDLGGARSGLGFPPHSSQYHLPIEIKSQPLLPLEEWKLKKGFTTSWRSLQPGALEMEPLPFASLHITRHHLPVRIFVTIAISRLPIVILLFGIFRFGKDVCSPLIGPVGRPFRIRFSFFN